MPARKEPPPFRDQLKAALDEVDISQRGLSQRLADLDPGDDGADPESKRRWLQKVLGEGATAVEWPAPQSVRELEEALGLPGYFRVPTRRRRRHLDRVEILEKRVAAISAVLVPIAREQGIEIPPVLEDDGPTE